MKTTELSESRMEIFKRPETKKDILGNNPPIIVSSFKDIVPALERRKEEGVIIETGVNIIPHNEDGDPLYYSSQNFSKRGPYGKINSRNLSDSIKDKWNPFKAREEAWKRYSQRYNPEDEKDRFLGWTWVDPGNMHHFVRPSIVIEGRRLEMYCRKSGEITEKIEIRDYSAKDSELLCIGANIPSRTEKNKYNVLMEHIAKLNSARIYFEWLRFSTRHSCKMKENDFTFRHSSITSYCPHDVAGYTAYSRRAEEKTGRIIPQIFPTITEPTLRLFMSASYHTMIREKINDKGHTRLRALTFPEIDVILMNAWLRYGNQPTFSITKKAKQMENYDWSINSTGMPFSK